MFAACLLSFGVEIFITQFGNVMDSSFWSLLIIPLPQTLHLLLVFYISLVTACGDGTVLANVLCERRIANLWKISGNTVLLLSSLSDLLSLMDICV